MCYVVVKKFDNHDGCVAFKTKTGPKLLRLKSRLENLANKDKDVEIVLISGPKMYGEYAPYKYVKTETELINKTKLLVSAR